MNVSLLLEFIDELVGNESLYPISDSLAELESALNSLAGNPQDQNAQKLVSDNLAKLASHLEDRSEDIPARHLNRLIEFDGTEYYTPELASAISKIINENPISPRVAKDFVTSVSERRKKFVENLRTVSESLRSLGISGTTTSEKDPEIGFEIPRSIFENELSGFVDEIRVTKFIVDAASMTVTGQRERITVEQLSTSDPLLILGVDPRVIAMVGGFVTWALHTWKQAEEIRLLKKKAKELPDMDEISEKLEQKIEESINSAIEKEVTKLLTKYRKKSKREIEQLLRRALRLILERLERGMKGECPIFCVSVIWFMLPERSKDDDDFQGITGRTAEGLRAA